MRCRRWSELCIMVDTPRASYRLGNISTTRSSLISILRTIRASKMIWSISFVYICHLRASTCRLSSDALGCFRHSAALCFIPLKYLCREHKKGAAPVLGTVQRAVWTHSTLSSDNHRKIHLDKLKQKRVISHRFNCITCGYMSTETSQTLKKMTKRQIFRRRGTLGTPKEMNRKNLNKDMLTLLWADLISTTIYWDAACSIWKQICRWGTLLLITPLSMMWVHMTSLKKTNIDIHIWIFNFEIKMTNFKRCYIKTYLPPL